MKTRMQELKIIIPAVLLWTAMVAGVSYAVGEPKDTVGYGDNAVVEYCDLHIEAVRFTESRGNQDAVSPVGAIGSMQVMPATANDPGFGIAPAEKNVDGSYNLDDIDRLGEEYLGKMRERYPNDFEAALIAYNAGPGNADMWILNGRNYELLPDRAQTEAYVNKVYTHYFKLMEGVS